MACSCALTRALTPPWLPVCCMAAGHARTGAGDSACCTSGFACTSVQSVQCARLDAGAPPAHQAGGFSSVSAIARQPCAACLSSLHRSSAAPSRAAAGPVAQDGRGVTGLALRRGAHPRGRAGHGVWRVHGGHCSSLPRAPHHERGHQGGRLGHLRQAHPHVTGRSSFAVWSTALHCAHCCRASVVSVQDLALDVQRAGADWLCPAGSVVGADRD